MNLLAPAGLFALLLLPIVAAIHLWRIRHRRYEVSSTLLWSQVLRQTPLRRPRHLPTRLLLLLLQLAALAAGAFALARPALVNAGAHRHLVVAIDTSLAMSAADTAPNRLARAMADAQSLIGGLGQGDTMTLIDAGTAPRELVTSDDHAVLRRALDSLRQGYGPSALPDLGPLLSGIIRAQIPAHERGSAAYLFAPYGTDRAVISALSAETSGLVVRQVGTTADDRGVAGLTIACANSACEAYARLVNTAPHAIATRLTAIVDNAILTQTVTLPANSAVPIGLTLPRDRGSVGGTVELRLDGRDPLPLDDAAWAVAPLPAQRAVLLVTGDPSSPLAQALHAIPNLALTSTTPDQYSDDMTKRFDLTVVDEQGADIQPPGNVFFVNPSATTALFTLNGSQTAPGVSPIPPPQDASPTNLRPGDLLAGVDLSSLVVASASKAPLPSWARTDIDGDSGPLLFSGVTGGRRVAVLLFDPRTTASANSSNLDTLLAFPTLLRNAVRLLAPAPPLAANAGAIAPLPIVRQGPAWIQPALAERGDAATNLASTGDLAALPLLRPGMYTFGGAAGGGAQHLALNPEVPGDSGGAAPAANAAPPAPVVLAPGVITPWDGWAAVVLLALAVLSGEWWYYVRRT